MQLHTDKAAFAVEFIDIEKASGIDGAKWEPFQIDFLNTISKFSADNKSRQIAWSFTAALDAVVDSIMIPKNPHIFVSINEEEAKEKIRYANEIIEAIDEPVRPGLVRASMTEIEFDNGSRLISHPCRPPRGKAGARIYLDEMAHYKDGLDREIYTASLPATTKKDGYVRIGSSPLGAKGLFWEIITEGMKAWPGFDRHILPWWTIKALCKDVKTASQLAPQMLTHERVYDFGVSSLVQIFENMFLEDFQQEYECAYIDEATAWITWEIIKRNQKDDLHWYHAKSTDEAVSLIEPILRDIDSKLIEPVLVGGLDIGRNRDLTELMLGGKSTTGQTPIRVSVSLDKVEFDDQEACFHEMFRRLPISTVLIDSNGIGRQLAENLARTGRAQGVDFTNPTKELWAVEARLQAERGNTPLPVDRDIAYQIHSIKKTVTAAKNNVFDTERNEKHHADKFWAWALMIWAANHGGAPLPDDQPSSPSKWTVQDRDILQDDDKKTGSIWRRY